MDDSPTPSPTMKSKTLVALALGSLLASCGTTSVAPENHWNSSYAGDRIVYQFTGYRGAVDGGFFGFMGSELGSIGTTSVRHFMNYNPANPLQSGLVDRANVPTPPPTKKFKVKNDTSPQRIF